MSTNQKILVFVAVCVAIAVCIFAYGYWKSAKAPTSTLTTASSTPSGKVAASQTPDGTYTVQIRSIFQSPEDTSIVFTHVTYFEGAEAKASAEHEAACKDQPIESCVPTLTRGYYVRTSGDPDFSVPANAQTMVTLKDKMAATVADLRNLKRDFNPVFDVDIQNGNIVSITEKSPVPDEKG